MGCSVYYCENELILARSPCACCAHRIWKKKLHTWGYLCFCSVEAKQIVYHYSCGGDKKGTLTSPAMCLTPFMNFSCFLCTILPFFYSLITSCIVLFADLYWFQYGTSQSFLNFSNLRYEIECAEWCELYVRL